jgi:hypothetical protein
MKGTEQLIIQENVIRLSTDNDNTAVMHAAEKSLMEKLAEITTKNGGDILEIGFGMNLSADAIQAHPRVTSHTIIEIHPVQYERALQWAKQQNKPTTVLLGDWIDLLPLEGKKFDGVLHDTHLDPNVPRFLDYVAGNCKPGTVVGFFEYPKFDTRLNGVRFSLDEKDLKDLPYGENIFFRDNQFELKYTVFDGKQFKSDSRPKSIL